jgi:hypothetical protein
MRPRPCTPCAAARPQLALAAGRRGIGVRATAAERVPPALFVLDAADGVALCALPATNFTAGTVAACRASSPGAVLLLRTRIGQQLATLQTADGRLLRVVAPVCAHDAARVDACGVPGDPATLLLLTTAENGAVVVQSAALTGTFLRVGEPPLRLAGATCVAAEATPLRRRVLTATAAAEQRAVAFDAAAITLPPPPAAPLSAAQLSAFELDGYIVLRGAVPPLALEAARRQAFAHVHAALAVQDDASRFGSDHPALLGLFSATSVRLRRSGAAFGRRCCARHRHAACGGAARAAAAARRCRGIRKRCAR